MAASKEPALEPAAGFSLESPERPDRVPLAKGEYSVASRALGLATYFLSGALAINISQFLGSPLKAINEDWYNAWIAFTKQSFGLLTMSLTQTFAPTKVIVSGDESVRGQLLKSADGNLILDFPERLVLIANHQIYTDWLYLWWIAYCNGMHGRLYIILKESLRKIPILGWGMQLSQFIFLKRNWEEDKPNMAKSLQKLNKPTDPMWLLLFPEGTNLAPSTRERSAKWAKKNGISDCKHTLLPRSTGLHFCLDELKGTVEWIYDITVAYEGVPRGQYAQDIFTLKSGYMEGRPPKSINMHFRRFAVKDIPLHNDKAFELWLLARWREKDIMIEEYYRTGKMPADYAGVKYKSGKILRGCGHMEVPIQASHWYEFLQIFAPMGILAMILYMFYGDLPQKFWKSINKQALQAGTQDILQTGAQAGKGVKSAGSAMGGLKLDDFFEPGRQEETFKAGAMAVSKLMTSPQAQTLLNRADFMQAFLSDPVQMVESTITDKQQNFMQQIAQEEAKRRQAGITPSSGTGFVRPAPSRTSSTSTAPTKKKVDFYGQLDAEESARRGSVISAPRKKGKGTFYDSLKAEEQSRLGSTTSTPQGQSNGTFWQAVKAREDKKNAPPLTKGNLAMKGNFWDAVKKEEGNRLGTVVTLSSNASTAVASRGPAPSRTSGAPAKLGAKKAQTAPVKAPSTIAASKAPKGPKSVAATAPTKRASVSAPIPKKSAPVPALVPSTAIQKPAPLASATKSNPTKAAPGPSKLATNSNPPTKLAQKPPTFTTAKPSPKLSANTPKPLAPKTGNENPVKKAASSTPVKKAVPQSAATPAKAPSPAVAKKAAPATATKAPEKTAAKGSTIAAKKASTNAAGPPKLKA